MVNVVIKGGSLSGNEGAAAMSLVAINLAKEIFPDAKITLISPRFLEDRKRAPSIEIVQLPIFKKSVLALAAFLPLSFINCSSIMKNKIVETYIKADIIFDVNGDMLTEDYGKKMCFNIMKEFLYPIRLKKPIVILPQSIGPFKSGSCRILAKYVFRNTRLLFVREKISERYLSAMGIRHDGLYCDLAFSLPSKEPAEFQNRSGYIGLSVSSLIGKFGNESKYINELSSFIDYLGSHGFQVIIIPHVKDTANDDRMIAKVLASKCKTDITITGDYDATNLKGIIAKCSIFIGARMHANIAALSQNIPTIAIAYSHKTHGIMQEFGLADYVIDIENISSKELIQKFNRLLREKESISRMMRQRNVEFSMQYNHMKERIKNEFTGILQSQR